MSAIVMSIVTASSGSNNRVEVKGSVDVEDRWAQMIVDRGGSRGSQHEDNLPDFSRRRRDFR